MTDTNIEVREHYRATGLTDRIKAALTTITPERHAEAPTRDRPLAHAL
jgi:hypothetical protein